MFEQRAAYTALAARLATVDLTLLIGVPTAIQALPAAYLVSTVIAVAPPATFGAPRQRISRLRPTLTLAVAWQDQTAAEWQIVDLVDVVALAIIDAPLADVCTATIETVTYGWKDVGGITYRTADVALILSQL